MIAPAGRKLGKYEIRQKLGRGGMADVYLANDVETNTLVALKLIEHSDDTDTKDFIEAERRGAELQAHLAAIDGRVARVYDAGDLDGYFFIAMEYVDGQDLSELMRKGPLEFEFAADAAIDIAQTLENAHNLQVALDGKNYQGIVHGDIKPKNIRVDSRGNVRVLDFGIAKALSLSRRLTRNEFGSVPYSSPERLDLGEVNALSDLWSLAVMLYEMVTGLQPYQASTTERLERMIRSRVPAPPAPDPCPDALRRILLKAMAPDPERRYRTAGEFAADLVAFRKGEPVQAVAEDLEATRRTFRPDDATRRTVPDADGPEDATRRTAAVPDRPGDATRQTTAPQNTPGASVEWPPRTGKPRRSTFGRVMRAALIVLLGFVLYVAFSAVSAYKLYERGNELARQIETEQVTDLDAIWKKWTELSKGNQSSWILSSARNAVRQRHVQAADRVIAGYRNGDQQVREGDWRRVRIWLSRALQADPDRSVRGELRLAEGHIARINNSATEAVQDFNDAHDLLPKSPDPYIGLARAYLEGFKDLDKARDAYKNAEKRGYALGNRDKWQLAEAFRDRAERLWWDTRTVRGLPQEKEQLQRAQQDYQSALDLYQEIAPFGNSSAQIVRVQADSESVRNRLQQIADEAGLGLFR